MLYLHVPKIKRLEIIGADNKENRKEGNTKMAEKIDMRIGEIISSDTVEMMIQSKIGRCHPLTQNRKGQYAVDLVQPYRLVFEKQGNEIQIANILEIMKTILLLRI